MIERAVLYFLGKNIAEEPQSRKEAKHKQRYLLAHKFFENRLATFGLWVVVALVLVAAFAPLIAPYGITDGDISTDSLLTPSWTHLFGTDKLGFDMFSRVVYGARITLMVVVIVSLVAPLFGLIIGVMSGYFGGWIDQVLMRLTDIFLAFPKLILALALAAALGGGIYVAIVAITLTSWPVYARLARAETLKIRHSDFIIAVKLQGASHMRLIMYHILPLCLPTMIIRATLDMAGVIMTIAGLGFLGLGAQPPSPEWGTLVASGREYFLDQWWLVTFPGLAIFIVSLGFNYLGDGIRDVLDPKSNNEA